MGKDLDQNCPSQLEGGGMGRGCVRVEDRPWRAKTPSGGL